ncbi:MAG: DUF294 nucleotidyltransferase-like domain-containing protein [Thermoanaerobaculia bacterium]
MDPIDFLVAHAPFSELSPAGRTAVARHLEISYARTGHPIFSRGGSNLYLWTVRKGSVRLELDGQRVDELGPGEIFGLTAVAGEETPSFDVVAESDCLLYRMHRDQVLALFAGEPRFAAHFLQSLTSRLHALTDGSPVSLAGDLRLSIGELISRTPVLVARTATVGDAARRMDTERVSSVLVVNSLPEADERLMPVGILTDRDLRSRVLAAGKGPETPIAEVMSSPVETVDASLPAAEALLYLLRRAVHHLPVARDGSILGVVTHADLVRHHQHGPGALLKKIEKARSAAALAHYADDVASMVDSLHRSRVEPTDIGRMVAALNDALVSHLIELALRELGEAPCPFAWIVFGSEGRQEQSFLTDQDNALIYEPSSPEDGAYFARFAERIVADLVRVGFPLCAGGFMATHWCDPLEVWKERFRVWIESPEPGALMKAANFFDLRKVHGALDLEPLERIIEGAGARQLFIAHLARAAMEMRPPLGLWHRIRESAEGIDLKAGALMPVVGLARVFALEAGEREGSTLRRLQAGVRGGALSEEGGELLAEAFRFAFALRLRHQLAEWKSGSAIDNRVHLDALEPRERRELKEAFLAIHRLQAATASRLGVDRLG